MCMYIITYTAFVLSRAGYLVLPHQIQQPALFLFTRIIIEHSFGFVNIILNRCLLIYSNFLQFLNIIVCKVPVGTST